MYIHLAHCGIHSIYSSFIDHFCKNICIVLYTILQNVLKHNIESTHTLCVALNNGGVWMWREKKVDVKTIKRIQCLQPPSVEDILNDPCLAIKSSTGLSYMLQDIVNSMDFNKPMKTAFEFAQVNVFFEDLKVPSSFDM